MLIAQTELSGFFFVVGINVLFVKTEKGEEKENMKGFWNVALAWFVAN